VNSSSQQQQQQQRSVTLIFSMMALVGNCFKVGCGSAVAQVLGLPGSEVPIGQFPLLLLAAGYVRLLQHILVHWCLFL